MKMRACPEGSVEEDEGPPKLRFVAQEVLSLKIRDDIDDTVKLHPGDLNLHRTAHLGPALYLGVELEKLICKVVTS